MACRIRRRSNPAPRDRGPESGIVRLLNTNPAIGHARPGLNLGGQIIENQITAFGSHYEYKMMFAGTDNHLAQQQRACGPAAIEKFVALGDSIVVAIPRSGLISQVSPARPS